VKEIIKLVHSITPTCLPPYRKYTLVPKPGNESHEAQVNVTEVIEDPNQSSEDQLTNPTQEGKPRCMIPVFQIDSTTVPFYQCI
jgi:hypothetical protein